MGSVTRPKRSPIASTSAGLRNRSPGAMPASNALVPGPPAIAVTPTSPSSRKYVSRPSSGQKNSAAGWVCSGGGPAARRDLDLDRGEAAAGLPVAHVERHEVLHDVEGLGDRG